MHGSMVLIGAALALAGGFGVVLPPGDRVGVVFSLLAGAGVGIASLAVMFPTDGDLEECWLVFFVSSIVGFATVVTGLTVTWRRARRGPAARELSPGVLDS